MACRHCDVRLGHKRGGERGLAELGEFRGNGRRARSADSQLSRVRFNAADGRAVPAIGRTGKREMDKIGACALDAVGLDFRADTVRIRRERG